MSDDRLFQTPADDTPAAQVARWEGMRQSQHEWIDNFPGISDAEKARRKSEFDAAYHANLAASGLTPAPEKTPQQKAEDRFEERWSPDRFEIGENLAASLQIELDRIAAVPALHPEMRADLERHYGSPAAYAQILKEAAAGSKEPLSEAAKHSRHALDLLSVVGRANAAHDRERATFDGARGGGSP